MTNPSKHQTKSKLRKGDKVVVLAGRSKGETGTVDKIDKKSSRVYLSGVNIYKRHTRPSSQDDPGGIIDKVMPLHLSNVAIADPKSGKPSRLGFKIDAKAKTRVSKASGASL